MLRNVLLLLLLHAATIVVDRSSIGGSKSLDERWFILLYFV